MVAKKLGKNKFKGEFKIIKIFLTSLGFELDRVGNMEVYGKIIRRTLLLMLLQVVVIGDGIKTGNLILPN